ncbi:MAG: GTP 3',8-cyclase MoaA [Candidatus Omnitrophota bacterium]
MTLALKTPLLTTKILDQRSRTLHDLRISVTERCNFRCPHCMPLEAAQDQSNLLACDDYLAINDIVRIAHIATKLGVSKIRLTGGEPLLRADLVDLVYKLEQLDPSMDIALTTNGYLLSKHLFALKAAGLKRLTISLNGLDEKTFHQMNGHRYNLKTVLEAIQNAEKAGFSPLKINVVVQRNINEKAILKLVEYFRGTPHILRFIEYMDVGTQNGWTIDQVVYAQNIFNMIHARYPLQALEENYPGETARRYAYEDGKGEIGLIASVSDPFCHTCNRLRLTPDGKLYTCLFAREGIDLKRKLLEGASDDEILETIKKAWQDRKDAYSQERCRFLAKNEKSKKIEMYKIGG